ncbi:uncharacterized protein LOC115691388 [Syzygium oleosum]|uniref:uncharacterized protein LOC115691388 n=1 Tax=Syzygium oleosum TaxID=219896 RepID=UPI0024B92C10|nr:uncharacterized protein LOC115691388 [Syzygium oleosum]
MGCSESKHDVAAGNTISLSKTSKADEPKEIQKDADTTPEAADTTSEGANTNGANLPTQKEGESEANTGSGGENVSEVANVGDVTQETEARAGEEKDGKAVTDDSSPTKEVDLSANVALADSVEPENVVEEKEEKDSGEPEIVKEENSIKELESVQAVDESKAASAEGAAANAATSDEKTN